MQFSKVVLQYNVSSEMDKSTIWYLFIFQGLIKFSLALSKCSEELIKPQFCKIKDEYPTFPFVIHPTIDIFDIIEINDDQQSITLYFQLLLGYNDTAAILLEDPSK